ncbi:hypothetical protein [Streptomyces cyaneofuscatus]|uniref:hypothetical protein n=1 Tax=Streptomyces cyaneofuscatus TaxID=66883 RepID=UPI00339FB64B
MAASTGEPAGRTPGRSRDELRSTATARHLAEGHGRDDIAAFLQTATDCGLDDLNALKNT